MHLSQLVTKEAALDMAFKSPAMRIKAKSKIRPNEEAANKAVAKAIETIVQEALIEEFKPIFEDVLADMDINFGNYEDALEKNVQDEWEAELDAKVEEQLQPYNELLSSDWLAIHTVDCQIQNPDGIINFCKALAKELYKGLTFDLTQAKIFSAVGIVGADVFSRLQTHLANGENGTLEASEISAIVSVIKNRLGPNPDLADLYDAIDLASDSDDILASGGAARLGLNTDQVTVLQNYRLEVGSEAVERLYDMVLGTVPEPIPEPAAPALAGKPKPKKEKTVAIQEPHLRPGILQSLQTCGLVGKDISEALGVSLSTYNKYVKGSGQFRPDNDQIAKLREETVDRLNMLHQVLAELDGTQALEIH